MVAGVELSQARGEPLLHRAFLGHEPAYLLEERDLRVLSEIFGDEVIDRSYLGVHGRLLLILYIHTVSDYRSKTQ